MKLGHDLFNAIYGSIEQQFSLRLVQVRTDPVCTAEWSQPDAAVKLPPGLNE